MNKTLHYILKSIVLINCINIFNSCKKEEHKEISQQVSLQQIAPFPVGNIYSTNGRDFYSWSYPNKYTMLGNTGIAARSQVLNNDWQSILDKEFSSITPETCLKMHSISVSEDQYDFTQADNMVLYAKNHNKRIHGHVLLWSSSVPEWIRHVNWTEQEYENWLEEYIKTIVGRYKNDIHSWDVVNEPLTPFFGTDYKSKNDNFWLYHIGEDYIEKAFIWAYEADPNALLFLNEVGAEASFNNARRKKIITIANQLRSKGIKVDGIGLQFHLLNADISDNDMKTIISDVISNNYLLHISEFDIQMNFPFGNLKQLNTNQQISQRKAYNTVVYNYLKLVPKENQYGITFWGISDINSFCNLFINMRLNQNSEDFPNLWDRDFKKKQVYQGVINGLKGIKE
jgi:endo-1,4-beta-xylanase